MLQATLNSKPENLRTILVREVGEMSTKPHTSLCMLLQFFEKEKIMLVICFLTFFLYPDRPTCYWSGWHLFNPSCILHYKKNESNRLEYMLVNIDSYMYYDACISTVLTVLVKPTQYQQLFTKVEVNIIGGYLASSGAMCHMH